MPEESHLAEMREQIRGDRERAARRRGRPLPPPPAATPAAPPERPTTLARLRRFLLGR